MSQQRCWKHFRLEDQKPNNLKPITKNANKGSCNECGHPIPGLIYNMRNYQNMGKHMYECYYEWCTKKTGFLRNMLPSHTSSPEIVSKKCLFKYPISYQGPIGTGQEILHLNPWIHLKCLVNSDKLKNASC